MEVLDLTGKIDLVSLIDLIGSADLLVSNDTSAVHVAAATGAKAVCVSNGNHFKRFNPYPSELSGNILTLYPLPGFSSNIESEIAYLIETCKIKSDCKIERIEPERVIDESVKSLALHILGG